MSNTKEEEKEGDEHEENHQADVRRRRTSG